MFPYGIGCKKYSTQGDTVSEIKPPDDSLSSYFDELLGLDAGDDHQIDLPLAVGDNLSSAKVVNLNSRNKSIQSDKKPVLLAQKSLVKPVPDYVEPATDNSDQEQKQKLEKLLQTARQQLLKPETKTDVKVEQQVQTPYVEVPDEIQDWPIETLTETEVATETAVATVENFLPQEARDLVAQDLVEDQLASEIANLEWAANGLPQWAQERFDVLLFNVAGLTLAVPLISLGQIYPLTDELTPLFGQADWFMGLQPTPMGKIRTVNTARFVMPEKYVDSCLDNAKYVMSLDGVPWGLALDSVNQPMRLDPDQVKWRSDRSKRPWLAGTVKEHMCALLDVPRIAQILLDADKNHKRRSPS